MVVGSVVEAPQDAHWSRMHDIWVVQRGKKPVELFRASETGFHWRVKGFDRIATALSDGSFRWQRNQQQFTAMANDH